MHYMPLNSNTGYCQCVLDSDVNLNVSPPVETLSFHRHQSDTQKLHSQEVVESETPNRHESWEISAGLSWYN